jgi:hypothetical protein
MKRELSKKEVHRLWQEEGLQVRVHSRRKRAGVSSMPQTVGRSEAVVGAGFSVRIQPSPGKAIKIASNEHTRESPMNVGELSAAGERLVDELEAVFAAAGASPMVGFPLGARRRRWPAIGMPFGVTKLKPALTRNAIRDQ